MTYNKIRKTKLKEEENLRVRGLFLQVTKLLRAHTLFFLTDLNCSISPLSENFKNIRFAIKVIEIPLSE